MKSFQIVLLLLVLLPHDLLWADAGVSERIQALSRQIEQNPKNPVPRLQRALAYMEDNQPEQALADVRWVESRGDPADAAYIHGVILFRQKHYTQARPYFDRYLREFPTQGSALGYRARLLRDIGENQLALVDYETLISVNDTLDPGYYLSAARLMADQPQRGVDDALALLDRRIAERGQVTSLQRYAIDLERQRGNYQAAIERMALLDEKLRATPQWQVDVAELLLLAGRNDEALLYLDVAQEQLLARRETAVNRQLMETAKQLHKQAQATP
ncbi:Beta-barrel assembly-enhancing protease [Halioglobus japonicus]|nr:Beta-barrel assembly-enhancing protease [Halioglobus japonicus]